MTTSRWERSTRAIDDARQGISTDPFGSAPSCYTGLRVPAFRPAGAPGTSGRFMFLLATEVVSRPTRLCGIRQLLTIGNNFTGNATTLPSQVTEIEVTAPTWSFVDGNVSWHLVYENNVRRVENPPLTDTHNFAFTEANDSALLYNTFTANNVQQITGQPINWPISLTAYTPPSIQEDWQPVCGDLMAFNDIRFPWDGSQAQSSLDIDLVWRSDIRVSLYASVLQTAGNVSFNSPTGNPGSLNFAGQESSFVQTVIANGGSVFYWRIAGAIILEDSSGD